MASRNYKIAVVPGDGTGPEVVAEGIKVLEAAASKFGFSRRRMVCLRVYISGCIPDPRSSAKESMHG